MKRINTNIQKEEYKMDEQTTIQNLLLGEIGSLTEKLDELTPGTDEYTKVNEERLKLIDRAVKMETFSIDNENKVRQIEDEHRDQIVKNILTAVSIVGGFALTVWGTIKSIKFEETGTITTIMGRGFINKLLPKK